MSSLSSASSMKPSPSRSITVTPWLRRVLVLDAVLCVVTAAPMLLGASVLTHWLELPSGLLQAMGVVLGVYALAVGWWSRRAVISRHVLMALIAINAVWAVDCLWIAFGTWFAPNAWGQLFLGAQVLTVIVFAELQFIGLRRGSCQV